MSHGSFDAFINVHEKESVSDDGDTASLLSGASDRSDITAQAETSQAPLKESFISISQTFIVSRSDGMMYQDSRGDDRLANGFENSSFPTLIRKPNSYEEMKAVVHEIYGRPASEARATLYCDFFGRGICLVARSNWAAVEHGSSNFVSFTEYGTTRDQYFLITLDGNLGKHKVSAHPDSTVKSFKWKLRESLGYVRSDLDDFYLVLRNVKMVDDNTLASYQVGPNDVIKVVDRFE